jgi:hypothetical protein
MARLRACAVLVVALLSAPAVAAAEDVSGFCGYRGPPQWRRYVGKTAAFVRAQVGAPDAQSRTTVVYRSVRCGSREGPASIWQVTLHLAANGRVARISQRRTGSYGCELTQ